MATTRRKRAHTTDRNDHSVAAPRIIAASATGLTIALSLAACASGEATTSDNDTTNASTSPSSQGTDTTVDGATYRAGTYTEEGSYQSPGGTEHIKVSLTINANGTIKAVKVTPESTDAQGQQFQTMFAQGISGEVVGKSVADVHVSKVSGSSLTGTGFNEAVSAIASNAKES